MLTEAFLNFITVVVAAILYVLPDGGTFPPQVGAAISTMYYYLRSIDFIIPYDTLVAVVTIGLLWELFCFVWWLVHWILRKIPVAHIT